MLCPTSAATVRRVRRRQPRGLALLIVLSVVAVASVLGWAMLSASAMRTKVESTTADALDASFLAESGVSYGLYYARYPNLSPVTIVNGSNGAWSATQAGVKPWSDATGTFDVAVSTPGDGTFSVTSAALVNGIKRTLLVNAEYSYSRYQVTHAAAFNGTFVAPANLTITGPVVAKSAVTGLGVLNFSAGTPAATGANVTPIYSELTLIGETGTSWPSGGSGSTNDRTYTYDGKTYHAEMLASSVTGTIATANATLNPMNVWYADSDVTLTNATLTGTLVLRAKKLTAMGTVTITSKATDMPALICDTIDAKQAASAPKLAVNGVAWVGNKLTNSGPVLNAGYVAVNGALLFGGTSPKIDTTLLAPITVTYASSVKKIPALSNVKTVNGIAVRGWKQS